MSKYQEALSSILFTMHYRVKPKKLGYCEDENFKILQELVDKTVPKKIMNVTSHDDHEFGDYVYSTGYCSICNKIFYFDALEDVINYCPNCGQKLSWDGKHERVGVV